jgi:hypothetical protein
MLYLIGAYWPFVLAALCVGILVGWWYQDPRSADDVTAWLERGPDEP